MLNPCVSRSSSKFVPYLGGIEICGKQHERRDKDSLYRTLEELKFAAF